MASERLGKGTNTAQNNSSFNDRVNYRFVPIETVKIEPSDKTHSLRRTFQVSWWERRTPIERKLIICLPILVLVVLVVIVVFVPILAKSSSGNSEDLSSTPQTGSLFVAPSNAEICVTWECVQTASKMMGSVNRSIDPCDDFFEFACGSQHDLFPDFIATHFARIELEQEELIKELLEIPASEKDIPVIRNAKTLYKSCLAEETFEKSGISQWLGETVRISDRLQTDWDITDLLAKLRLITSNQGLFYVYVEADAKNSDKNIIYFDQPKKLPLVELNTTKNTRGSHPDNRTLSAIGSWLGITDRNTTINIYKEAGAFAGEIKNIMTPSDDRQDHNLLYNWMTLADMNRNLTQKIDWLKFLRLIFDSVNITIEENEPVVVLSPDYFISLGNLLSRTPPRTIATYLMWTTSFSLLDSLVGDQQIYTDIDADLDMVDVPFSKYVKSLACVNFVKQHLGFAVSRMYLDKHFQHENKKMVNEIVLEIKAAFEEIMSGVTWMDDTSKKLLKEKIAAMEAKIAYPDDIFNDTMLNDMYKDLDGIIVDNFKESAVKVRQVSLLRPFASLRQPVNRFTWLMSPITVNAYYAALRNQIIIPAGIIQPPFFQDVNFSRAINFGGIGYVIGHEIAHGFSDKGRQYDRNGNLGISWPQNVSAMFDEKGACFIDQYSSYTAPNSNMRIDGFQTLNENTADNAGLQHSFRAYENWVKKRAREEAVLPGLYFTGSQIFFLQFAQAMCSRTEFDDYGQSNKHSPRKIRVIGTLSNSYDFAQAYGCKAGSRMNPVKKCSVW